MIGAIENLREYRDRCVSNSKLFVDKGPGVGEVITKF